MTTEEKIERLQNMSNERLFEVVRNHRLHGYEDEIREAAISILNDRGIDRSLLKLTGNFSNPKYDLAQGLYKDYFSMRKIAYTFYILTFSNLILTIVLAFMHVFVAITLITQVVFLLAFFGFLIKSFILQVEFYKVIGKPEESESPLLYFALGMPLYALVDSNCTKKMQEQMKMMN